MLVLVLHKFGVDTSIWAEINVLYSMKNKHMNIWLIEESGVKWAKYIIKGCFNTYNKTIIHNKTSATKGFLQMFKKCGHSKGLLSIT